LWGDGWGDGWGVRAWRKPAPPRPPSSCASELEGKSVVLFEVLEVEGGLEGGRGPDGQSRSAADGRAATLKCARRDATSDVTFGQFSI